MSHRNYFSLLLLFLFTPALSLFAQKKGYEITVKIEGISSDTIRMAYHYGNKQYIKDTSVTDANGVCVFSGDEPLPGGIYMISPISGGYFEFVVTDKEQKFTLETKKEDMTKNLKAIGSKENQVFYQFQQHMAGLYQAYAEAQATLKDPEATEEEKAAAQKIVDETNTEDTEKKARAFRKETFEKHPDNFFIKVLKTMEDPIIPPAPVDEKGVVIDSTWDYYWLKDHYFDNVDFSDERLLRTPVYQSKLMRYFEKMIVPMPDSINSATDKVIGLSEQNEEVFKFTLITIFNHYINSKTMGMDAVYSHIAKKYYLSGKATWADSTQLAKIAERVEAVSQNLIGNVAPELILVDSTRKMTSTHIRPEEYVVLFFWDPDCGHCKKTIPVLKEWYDKVKAEKRDIEVVAITISQKEDPWKKFIIENDLNWVNLMDYYGRSKMRDKYDIYSTPVVYLLDKDRKILAKRIDVPTLEDMMNRLWGETKK